MLISFPGFDRMTARVQAPAPWQAPLRQMRGYWEALCDGAAPPLRSQIDPRGIEGTLGTAFVLERVAPGVARFRIAGMALSDLAGCDPRGMPLSVLFEPGARRAVADTLNTVFDDPAEVEFRLEAERGMGRPALSAQMLLLPLRNDAGVIDLALGCLALSGDPGRRSRRFHIASTNVTPMLGAALRNLPETDFTPIKRAVGGTQETLRPLETVGAERAYLRLVGPAE